MRLVALLAALLMTPRPADATDVRPTLSLDAMRVEIIWVEAENDIRRHRAKYGNRASVGPVGGRETGFSVLVRRSDGEYSCRLYVLKPQRVNDARTLTLGHELLHCALGSYHD